MEKYHNHRPVEEKVLEFIHDEKFPPTEGYVQLSSRQELFQKTQRSQNLPEYFIWNNYSCARQPNRIAFSLEASQSFQDIMASRVVATEFVLFGIVQSVYPLSNTQIIITIVHSARAVGLCLILVILSFVTSDE